MTYTTRDGKALVIGISGDSGSGKDTLSRGVAALFGDVNVVQVSGDDYHRAERHDALWNETTHLDPAANDLARLATDVRALAHGRSVSIRPYDHRTGRFGPDVLVAPRPVVVVNGLHTLYTPELREELDLCVHLDTEEELRRRLKRQRDVHKRNHTHEELTLLMSRREGDAVRYIRTQGAHADLVIQLSAERPADLSAEELSSALPLVLDAHATGRWSSHVDAFAGCLGTWCRVLPGDQIRSDKASGLHVAGPLPTDLLTSAARSLHASRCAEVGHTRPAGVLGATALLVWHLALCALDDRTP
ncbi:MAG: hypothetical protein R3B40_15215 [Polyangiales bacterium]|nr:hypothetical protein [Myxococcales bacterium]MCB9658310.1 hypothetical protein [Sandaracinaceae bacterium]